MVPEFGNQYLRFGQTDNSGNSVNPGVALNGKSGSLYGPEYFNGTEWLQGTYRYYNFGIGLGVGGDGSSLWNLNGNLYRNDYDEYADLATPNQGGGTLFDARKVGADFTVDTSGLTGSTGSFTWSGVFEFADPNAADGVVEVRLSRTYSLGENAKYIKEATEIENIDPDGDELTNVRLWLGVGDDYVGDEDGNDKIKGNI